MVSISKSYGEYTSYQNFLVFIFNCYILIIGQQLFELMSEENVSVE